MATLMNRPIIQATIEAALVADLDRLPGERVLLGAVLLAAQKHGRLANERAAHEELVADHALPCDFLAEVEGAVALAEDDLRLTLSILADEIAQLVAPERVGPTFEVLDEGLVERFRLAQRAEAT